MRLSISVFLSLIHISPIAGAVFGLYADEDIKNADGRVIIEKGTLLEKATSDENGKIAFVKDLSLIHI